MRDAPRPVPTAYAAAPPGIRNYRVQGCAAPPGMRTHQTCW
ncbi:MULTISPECIES: hypothetical protein [unclassified Streptomyces]|nr:MULTISPECIES: hypothetical protein [unclassified Streptomyces]